MTGHYSGLPAPSGLRPICGRRSNQTATARSWYATGMGHERANIARMHGYVPGKQPASSETIKLNTNENPYPPCDAVMRELAAIPAEVLRRYPPPSAEGFRECAAALHGVGKDQVVAV